MEILQEELIKRGQDLYGINPKDWKFRCTYKLTGCKCTKVQSFASIIERLEKGMPPCAMFGLCLLMSNILVIIDPSKPHNRALEQNCYHMFPLANDAQMLAADQTNARSPCDLVKECLGVDGLFCDTFAHPFDECLKYQRFLIRAGNMYRAGWEFNPFEVADFDRFWKIPEHREAFS